MQEGTVNADTQWQCVSDKGGTIGTTAIDFVDLFTALTPPGEITENYDTAARAGWISLDGATIVDGALDNPKCAARYPWMVSGDDLVLPDRRGTFDRIWANGSANDPNRATRTAARATARPATIPAPRNPTGSRHIRIARTYFSARCISTTLGASTVLRQWSPVASWLEIVRAAPRRARSIITSANK
ncbi:MAG: hypothetical protein A49_23170 [Methyloceanibacter sp.]|nr:MAG: hypothetical protein A49_23170 [Methyloceanibacter sp.]